SGPGVHDHTPHHGGVVGMAGDLHLEALAAPDGRVRVWLRAFWRRPLPATSATGTVTLELAQGDRRLPLAAAGDSLEANGPALDGSEVTAHFALSVGGKAVEMDFVLLAGAGGAGAAGVPVHGCVALAARPGAARAPHCTLDFAHPVTVVAATPGGALALVAAVDLGVSAWRCRRGSWRSPSRRRRRSSCRGRKGSSRTPNRRTTWQSARTAARRWSRSRAASSATRSARAAWRASSRRRAASSGASLGRRTARPCW